MKTVLPSFPPPPVSAGSLLLFAFPASVTASTTAAAAPGTSLFGLLQQGGWAMWPLGLLMLASFYLAYLCTSLTRRQRFTGPEGLAATMVPALRRGEIGAARTLAAGHDSVLARLLQASFGKAARMPPAAARDAAEQAFAEAGEAEENRVSQWVNYLNVVATVAPMVGLLGTVSGMISAFQTIGRQGMGQPQELAGNIGEALITTASGLVIGIPAMVAYFYFRNRLSPRMIEVSQEAGILLDEFDAGARVPETK